MPDWTDDAEVAGLIGEIRYRLRKQPPGQWSELRRGLDRYLKKWADDNDLSTQHQYVDETRVENNVEARGDDQPSKYCTWSTEDGKDCWKTTCDRTIGRHEFSFHIIYHDFDYCPFCSGKLVPHDKDSGFQPGDKIRYIGQDDHNGDELEVPFTNGNVYLVESTNKQYVRLQRHNKEWPMAFFEKVKTKDTDD